MSSEPSIRTARHDDIPACLSLLRELFTIEVDFDFEEDKARSALERLVKPGPDHIVYVADATGVAVGMVSLQVVISTAEGGPVGWLEDLVVLPNWRSRGLGTRLLAQVETWANEHGLKRIQLVADRTNIPALEFYRQQGWQDTRLVALRHLPTSS